MEKLIVIDGNSLLFRAYFATSFTGNIMTTKSGIPTNAIYAFNNMLMKIISSLKEGDRIFVSFDTGKKTFRHEKLESYKAQRKPADPALVTQMPIARELLDALSVFHFELVGYEGDDIAGTVAKSASKKGMQVNIYTSDKDFLQLIDDHISVYMLRKGLTDIEVMNEDSLKTMYNLTPDQVRDFKGLMGDPSDNLKGIPGVGEKTAIKLISQYGSLEKIIEGVANDKSKLAQKIIDNKESGLLCKEMATILTDVILPFSLDELVYKGYNYNTLSNFYTKYEFFSALKKLKPCAISISDHQKVTKEVKESFDIEYINKFNEASHCKVFVMDQESGNYHKAPINGFVFADEEKVYYLTYDKAKNDKGFIKFIEDENNEKITYDMKAIKVALARDNIHLHGVKFDLFLASYLINSSLDNDAVTIFAYFGINILEGETISLFENDNTKFNMAHALLSLYPTIIEKLKEINCYDLLNNLEIPLADVLSDMEIEGFPLDKLTLKNINDKYQVYLDELTQKIYGEAGEQFNISSPKQLANILFHKLNLRSNKKESTSAAELKYLYNAHPIIPLILEYRKYSKIINTYTTGLTDYIYEDGKIHAMFNQALTTTGRLSSSEPNLQNISVRSEEGKIIRKAFFYKEDNLSMLSLDYSQIELRLLASLSHCQALIDVFKNGHDIHAETAAKVFNCNLDDVTPLMRRKAKAVNFGIVYGISDWGLSEQLDISPTESKQIIEKFYSSYPEIKTYFSNVVAKAKEDGFVTTLFNRRRYIPELSSDNYQTREFGKRAAMNAPIQGSAADLIKIAMINVAKKFKEHNLKSKMVLSIHDELIFKVYDEEKDLVYKLVKDTMENCVSFDVPLEVDGSFGKTWYDAK